MFQLFFLFRKSHEAKSPPVVPSYESEAVVSTVVQQGRAWRVSYAGSWWKARSRKSVTLHPGDRVYVKEVDNITLIIEPLNGEK